MTALWHAWCWLPMWSQILICALAWMGSVECIALVCAGSSYAEKIDRERASALPTFEQARYARASTATATGPRLLAQSTTSPGGDAGTCAPPGSGPGNFSERVASRRGVASREALGARPFRPGTAR